MQYFYKDLFNHNNPFYIHAYTQSSRREAYLSDNENFVIVGGDRNLSKLEKEIILNSSDHYYCYQHQDKLHRWASINHLLDAHNISHFSSDYMPETNTYVNDFIDKHELILKNELEIHSGKLKNFNDVTDDFEKTSCLHETVEGHQHLADYIWKEIEKKYDDIPKIITSKNKGLKILELDIPDACRAVNSKFSPIFPIVITEASKIDIGSAIGTKRASA